MASTKTARSLGGVCWSLIRTTHRYEVLCQWVEGGCPAPSAYLALWEAPYQQVCERMSARLELSGASRHRLAVLLLLRGKMGSITRNIRRGIESGMYIRILLVSGCTFTKVLGALVPLVTPDRLPSHFVLHKTLLLFRVFRVFR